MIHFKYSLDLNYIKKPCSKFFSKRNNRLWREILEKSLLFFFLFKYQWKIDVSLIFLTSFSENFQIYKAWKITSIFYNKIFSLWGETFGTILPLATLLHSHRIWLNNWVIFRKKNNSTALKIKRYDLNLFLTGQLMANMWSKRK